MGYTAYGSGTIVLKEEKVDNLKEVIDRIQEVFSDLSGIDDDGQEHIEVTVCHSDSFHSDEALEMLTELNACTQDGLITMEGEDGCRWRYRFDKDAGAWDEENCYEVYSVRNNVTGTYEVPAYVLTKEKASGTTEIIEVFADQQRAIAECKKRNDECTEEGIVYWVVKTTLNI